MGRVATYKIGLTQGVDKNSAQFEYKLIENAVSMLNVNNPLLIIVNGKFNDLNEKLQLLDVVDKQEFYKIFVVSDEIAFDGSNMDIASRCNIILHQSPRQLGAFNAQRQHYSWVPELFTTSDIWPNEPPENQEDTIIFGGGIRDQNEDAMIRAMLLHVDNFIAYSTLDGIDNRLPYLEYQNKVRHSKYSFIMARDRYVHDDLVTARFVEAIMNWSYPVLYYTYDDGNHFEYVYDGTCCGKFVVTHPDNFYAGHILDKIEPHRLDDLAVMRTHLLLNKNNFSRLVLSLDKYASDDTRWRHT